MTRFVLALHNVREVSLGYSSTRLLQYTWAPDCSPLTVPLVFLVPPCLSLSLGHALVRFRVLWVCARVDAPACMPGVRLQALSINPSVASQIPDVVSGVLAGPAMQLSVVNGGSQWLLSGLGSVVSSLVLTAAGDVLGVNPVSGSGVFGAAAPGQAFGVVLFLAPTSPHGRIPCSDDQHVVASVEFEGKLSSGSVVASPRVNVTLQCSSFSAAHPYRFTFWDEGDGSVQVRHSSRAIWRS